jgi:hypothetical protein
MCFVSWIKAGFFKIKAVGAMQVTVGGNRFDK